MIRSLKIGLVLLVAFWALSGLFGNLSGLQATYGIVAHVTSMPMFKPGEGPPWGTSNALVVWLGVALIVCGKLSTFVTCGLGGLRMARARTADSAAFAQAKALGVFGCGLTVAWLFFGWPIVGENVFFMYLDPIGEGSSATAFRVGGFIGLIGLFVAQAD